MGGVITTIHYHHHHPHHPYHHLGYPGVDYPQEIILQHCWIVSAGRAVLAVIYYDRDGHDHDTLIMMIW